MIRFHLDQHVSNVIARGLRLRGIDVTTTAEAGLQDAPDERQLAHILESGRVIFTQDDDFLRIHEAGEEHPGIVYSKAGYSQHWRDYSLLAAHERLSWSAGHAQPA